MRSIARIRLRAVAALLAAAFVVAACSGDDGPEPVATGSPGDALEIYAEVASTDLVAGEEERVLVGLLQRPDNFFLSYGEVEMSFSYLGTERDPVEPTPLGTATARFVPAPGGASTDGGSGAPELVPPSEARGVYQADAVFADPGFWQVDVSATTADDRPVTGTASFAVVSKPAIPYPGDEALHTRNHVLGEKRVPEEALDSRAATEGSIPDPALHRWTIAGAIDAGVPALVSFATPVYCESQFCGPVVEEIEGLERRYRDRAAFVHVEIWRDFQDSVLNQAAADWLYRNDTLTEPWLFLIGSDGTIVDRWGPLFDPAEVEAALDRLPKLPAGTEPT